MFPNKVFLIIMAGLLLSACKSYAPESFPDTQLHFGSGGGFTGMTTEYVVLPNGQLFKKEGRAGGGEWEELERVSRKAARGLYRRWKEHEVFREDIRQPGNRYYFISMSMDSLDYRQSWGAGGYEPHEQLTTLYEEAMALARSAAAEHERNGQ